MQAALGAAHPDEAGESVKTSLMKLYSEHGEALAKALDARMRDRLGGMERLLAEREAKEIDDITLVLTELQRSIQSKLDDPKISQMTFEGWTDPEREQLERNMDALRRRVREIPREIEHETAAIKARFAAPKPRMFPVAVTCLVPNRLTKVRH